MSEGIYLTIRPETVNEIELALASFETERELQSRLAIAKEFEALKADPVSYIRSIIAAEFARVEIENEFLESMQDAAPVDTGKDRGIWAATKTADTITANTQANESPRLVSIEDRLAALENAAPDDIGKDRGISLEGLRNAFGYGATYTTEEIDGDR